ncbi:sensor histidine kinase [Desulfopila aestuarii]|uniref:histidine kinase n=1 Tax=Desulfopila aestuarii DSM 18488 TaxID=1121416 RepID=A0A1M7YHW9_9BACT|nr:HAMP domain-containing sensor histidine kinase [Desulfopila aestuarii]SHO52237.1 Signal transduction histidine kinase [Desulfopila aestuarii DSM 18488]
MRLSLQTKFILVTFLAVFGIIAVIGLVTAAKTRTALYLANEKQGRILAQTVSALIINELIYEKLGLVEEGGLIDNYMRDLHQRSDIALNSVAVLDNGLRVISHSDFREFGKIYTSDFIRQAQETDNVQVRKNPAQNDMAASLEFAAPLSIEGKRWGVLTFSLSLAEMDEEMKDMIAQILSLSIMALLLLFLLIYLLSRQFIKPVIDLSEAMGEVEVEMGEKTVQVSGNDELARLAESYNEMVKRIRRANEEMKLAHEKLLQSEKLATLGVLSSSIAHRINNPLGGLFNCVSMLRRQGEDQQFRTDYLNLVEEGLQSIKETVGQLLYTAGKREGEARISSIDTVLNGVLRFLDYRLKKQNILFTSAVENGISASIAPHDLEEIFLNTMINAVQAMPAGGELLVEARRAGKNIELLIRDTGIGIPEENLSKVFALFYSTKKDGEGTGLGMWMTYELVKKYKGDISVTSKEQIGTTVTITIPEVT